MTVQAVNIYRHIIWGQILLMAMFFISCTPFQKEIKQENKINHYHRLFTYVHDSIKNDYTRIEVYKNILDTINSDKDIFQTTKRNRIIAQIYDLVSSNYSSIQYLDSALVYIDKAIEQDSSNSTYYYNKGCIAQNCNLDSIALDCYNIFLENYKESPNTYYNIAVIYYNNRNYNKSIESLKQALNYESDIKPFIYNNLGSSYFQIAQYDEAIEAYNKALALDSTVINAYINSGETYLKLDQKGACNGDVSKSFKAKR